MGSILDRNVAPEVFGPDRTEAGKKFFDWINAGAGRLVVGGKLIKELASTKAGEWVKQAILSKRVKILDKAKVNTSVNKRDLRCNAFWGSDVCSEHGVGWHQPVFQQSDSHVA